jgi:hypothetical protein
MAPKRASEEDDVHGASWNALGVLLSFPEWWKALREEDVFNMGDKA